MSLPIEVSTLPRKLSPYAYAIITHPGKPQVLPPIEGIKRWQKASPPQEKGAEGAGEGSAPGRKVDTAVSLFPLILDEAVDKLLRVKPESRPRKKSP